MAQKRRAQDSDVISRVADVGEDALRWLVSFPRHMVVEVLDGLGERLQDTATKLREIDPLVGRVAALETRLDSLEKPKERAARRASTRRATRPTPRSVSTAVALVEPEHAEQGGRPDEGRAQEESEQGQAPVPSDSTDASPPLRGEEQ
jgi:hypothetical protein